MILMLKNAENNDLNKKIKRGHLYCIWSQTSPLWWIPQACRPVSILTTSLCIFINKVQDRTTFRESSRVWLDYIIETIIRRIHWHWIFNFKYGSYTTKNSAHIQVDNMVCSRIMCFKFSIKLMLHKIYISNLRSRLSEICTVNKIYKTKFTLQKFTNRAFKLKKL